MARWRDIDKPLAREQTNPWGRHTESRFLPKHQFPLRCPKCHNLAAEYFFSVDGKCPNCNWEPRRKKTVRDMAVESYQINAAVANRDPDKGLPGPPGWNREVVDIMEDTRGGMDEPAVLAPDFTPQPMSGSKGDVARNLMKWTINEDRARSIARFADNKPIAPLKSSVPKMVHRGVSGRQIA